MSLTLLGLSIIDSANVSSRISIGTGWDLELVGRYRGCGQRIEPAGSLKLRESNYFKISKRFPALVLFRETSRRDDLHRHLHQTLHRTTNGSVHRGMLAECQRRRESGGCEPTFLETSAPASSVGVHRVLDPSLELVCEAVKGLPQIGGAPAELVLHALGLTMTDRGAFDADASLIPQLAHIGA